ncbi:acyltransferase family protein [Lysobacter niabensis]|uniref:acyltransferase family protein n=1 Tax=Agrilutibacter niabensis TaxID=380628 RepID=UPI003621AF7D
MSNNDHSGFRPEIQGLRAIAVMLVLVYHIWPAWLPGGYTGVDVFFVISGYLITALLVRELEFTGGISLPKFYVRRARRLLPASLITLVATLAATVLLLPVTLWRDTAHEVGAAAMYFENWWLAFKAIDYLAIESNPSPVQHFWSLSVEEQYYFVWPALLAGVYALVRRLMGAGSFRTACSACLVLVIVASLGYSIHSGLAGETAAYFSSFSRVWQLAAGGLLALLGGGKARTPVLVAGLLGILAAALLLDNDIAYPGYAALLPTVATVMAIQAGAAYSQSRLTRWLGYRPVQYLGDISYSLYLWHWPVIIFAKHRFGDSIGPAGNIALLLASIVLAGLSKHFIEDRFRSGQATRSVPSWRVLSYAMSASLACVGLATLLVLSTGNESQGPSSAGNSAYPGAATMLRPGPLPAATNTSFLPALVNVEDDVSIAYAQGCIQNIQGVDVKTCVFGKDTARYKIAVVGDSHAVHWFPAFEEIARHSDVQVVGISKTSCITAGLPLQHLKLKGDYPQCTEWTNNVIAYLNSRHFDYVILSQSPKHRLYGMQAEGPSASASRLAAGMRKVWSGLARGPKVLVLRSTPWQPTLVRECAASRGLEFPGCTGTEKTVLSYDVMSRFAQLAHYPLIDFTDLFCRDGRCPAVIGNVFVYRDAHHITATYARTLAPMLAERLSLPGAAAVAASLPAGSEARINARPSPALASQDRGEAFADGCVQSLKQHAVISCRYGLREGKPRIAVVGDSMGANLVPALNAAVTTKRWSMDTYFKDSCLFGATPVYNRRLKRAFTECSRWNAAVLRRLQSTAPDLVILMQSPQYIDKRAHTYDEASPALERGISAHISALNDAGIRVAVLRYLPWMPFDVPQCLMTRGDVEQCSTTRALGMRDGPLLRIARRSTEITVIDINDAFCGPKACMPIIDGLLVYRDAMQPTATFARTLDDEIAGQLSPLLKNGPAGMAKRTLH